MKLGEKIRYLREVEGSLRGMERAMSQQELVRAIEAETGSKLSQSYLSQIESGARPHLTNTSRQILARFFKVHPGYLVDDPDGYSPGVAERAALSGRQARSLAGVRRGAVSTRSGAEAGAADAGPARALAGVSDAAGIHSGDAGTGAATG